MRLPNLRRALTVPLVAAVCLAALLAWQLVVFASHVNADDRRSDAVAVAKAQVTDLTTLTPATVAAKTKAMSARETGDFKKQFDGFVGPFSSAVTDDKISSSGQIASAALVTESGSAATVIVAALVNVTTSASPQPVQRGYRMSVALSRIDDRWLISGMEFVK